MNRLSESSCIVVVLCKTFSPIVVNVDRNRVEKVWSSNLSFVHRLSEPGLDPKGRLRYVAAHSSGNMTHRLRKLFICPHVPIPEEEFGAHESPFLLCWVRVCL